MNNNKVTTLAVVAMLIVTGVTIPGIAIAQESGNAPTENNSTESAGDSYTPDTSTSVTKIGDSVTLKDYNFAQDGTITVWIETGYTQNIVLSDMWVKGDGAQTIPQKRVQIDQGMNKISFDTTSYKGSRGVIIGSSSGAVRISEEVPGTATFTSSYDATTLILMTIVGIVTGIGLVLLLAYKRELDYTNDIEQFL